MRPGLFQRRQSERTRVRAFRRTERAYVPPIQQHEAVPGEGSSVKLAKKDKIFGYNGEHKLYSNQFIPFHVETDVLNRIMLNGKFDSLFSGGSILHINTDVDIKDGKILENLIVSIAKQGVVYWARNTLMGKCRNGHFSPVKRGEHKCEQCGEVVDDLFTRVVGFITPVKSWSKEKREDDFNAKAALATFF